MPHTITEKILAAHTDKKEVEPKEFILARVDLAFANDITAPIAIHEFRKSGAKSVFDASKIALIPDHFTPSKDIRSAEHCRVMRDFARETRIENYFEVGEMGIEHALLPEKGLIVSGDLVIGADSHTCTHGALGAFAMGVGSTDLAACMVTGEVWLDVPASIKFVYKGKLKKWVCGKDIILFTIGKVGVDGAAYHAMEFTGEAIERLPMDERFTICNMAVEAGATSGIIAPDKITEGYIRKHSKRKPVIYKSDAGAKYAATYEYDLSKLEPQIAFPSLPDNAKDVGKASNVNIDQVVIGSCTNGRLSDLEIAAKILRGKKVYPYVRCIIIPATQEIYKEAMKRGLFDIFIKAGAVVSTPTCGPCLGGHMGILAKGEKAIATTNRNFVGRMGHPESEVYLASPAVCAASAILGRIAHPAEV
ncbi:MAG: 3-isopropylmalate dehydratase large subunit [Candidatus Omnitrophica bacterium]|nr:3-isopropylmalate dehydratase large subunit [Candidatus Omnitrophota bacterium]